MEEIKQVELAFEVFYFRDYERNLERSESLSLYNELSDFESENGVLREKRLCQNELKWP